MLWRAKEPARVETTKWSRGLRNTTTRFASTSRPDMSTGAFHDPTENITCIQYFHRVPSPSMNNTAATESEKRKADNHPPTVPSLPPQTRYTPTTVRERETNFQRLCLSPTQMPGSHQSSPPLHRGAEMMLSAVVVGKQGIDLLGATAQTAEKPVSLPLYTRAALNRNV